MEILTRKENKEIWFHQYQQGENFEIPFEHKPFVCIVWNDIENFVDPILVEKLLKNKCKYFIAGGKNCDAWEFTADDRHISMYPNFTPPDSEHVMTTSHKKEGIEEVLWYALHNTNFHDYIFDKFLFIQVGTKFSKKQLIEIIHHEISS